MMAITNHLVRLRQDVQVGRQRAERNELRALDAAYFEFPRLPDINEHYLFAPVEPCLHFRGRNLQLVHILFILPSTPACAFPERRERLPVHRAFASARISIPAPLLRALSKNRASEAAQESFASNRERLLRGFT